MGNRESKPQLELIGTDPLNTPFRSGMLSDTINEAGEEVEKVYSKFEKEQNVMEILLRQATSISRQNVTKTLTEWETELKVEKNDYPDLMQLHKVFAPNNPQDWPKHVDKAKPWETIQDNQATTNLLYFYVKHTESDANKFDMAMCHLITNKIGVSLNVLIGVLCKKGCLRRDGDNKVYLMFRQECEYN